MDNNELEGLKENGMDELHAILLKAYEGDGNSPNFVDKVALQQFIKIMLLGLIREGVIDGMSDSIASALTDNFLLIVKPLPQHGEGCGCIEHCNGS